MQTVYADASSLILLEKSGGLDLCLTPYRLVISSSVYDEISNPDYPDADSFKARVKRGELEVLPPPASAMTDVQNTAAILKLDRGERDTLLLYLNGKNGFILTDDGPAARLCFKSHIPFINALLVPRILNFAGLLKEDQCEKQMDRLCRIGRYSKEIKIYAGTCSLNDLRHFLPGNEDDEYRKEK